MVLGTTGLLGFPGKSSLQPSSFASVHCLLGCSTERWFLLQVCSVLLVMSDGLLAHETHGEKLPGEGSVNDLSSFHPCFGNKRRSRVFQCYLMGIARALKKTENCFLELAETKGGFQTPRSESEN